MAKTVLVSGGAGFIGSHVTVELISAGYDVVVADNMSNCDMTCFEGVKKITGREDLPLVKMDFCEAEAVEELFTTYKIDAVIHFAGFKAVGESVYEPLKYYGNNLTSFINVIETSRRHGCENILFSSSATVYGEPDKSPVTEKSPRKPATSPYGNTKQISEEIIRDVIISGAPIKSILLRYFNPIGAHPSAKIGELPVGVPQNLVPYITQTAAGIRKELTVFGDDYNTPDGSCIRDYIDVNDLAAAHVIAMERMLSREDTDQLEVFNLGTGNGLSVLELVNAFQKATGVKVPYKIGARREGDIEKIWADPKKANEVLGWKAETPINETMANAWRWQCTLPK